MDSNPEGNGMPDGQEPAVIKKAPPDREVVAQLALDLTRANANPLNEEHLTIVREDIETHGLPAYFNAAVQTIAAEEARQAQAVAGEIAPEILVEFGVTEPPPAFIIGAGAGLRTTWRNCISSRTVQPLRTFRPSTLAELRDIVRDAETLNCRVKAVGSGHSFADVAATRDFLIETHGLCRPIPIEADLLRPGAEPATLFETEAGITVRALNEALWKAGLGLVNMGGYDGQTIAGVISTSTHGSGLAFGPLPDQAVSLTIVAAGGRTVRVEPGNGITDPSRWAARHPEIELIQSDDWFHACQVGMGCLGIIYSVVLRARPRFFLREQRTLSTWSSIRQALQSGQVLHENEHYEVLVNPYITRPDGDHTCLVTRRNPTPAPVEEPVFPPSRNVLIELAASIPGPSEVLLKVINAFPWFTPNIIDGAMQAIDGEYIDRSYRVFNIGMANEVPGYGSEIGFPITTCLEAVDRILEITVRRQALGQAYLTSPFSLRFVKASQAFLSMMQGVDTCMVEFISINNTIGGIELLQEIEAEMYALGGRPHWGLLNFLTGAGGLIEAMYPLLPAWQQIRCELDPNGRFGNAFTERCGLTPHTFARI